MTIKLSLERYGERGWEWTQTVSDGFETTIQSLRTDGSGDGLWAWKETGNTLIGRDQNGYETYFPEYEWKQIDGICQFSLPSSRKAADAKIRRWINGYFDPLGEVE
jgi:hypothetical protein